MNTRMALTLVAVAAALLAGCETGVPRGHRASDTAPHLDGAAASAAGLRPQEVSDANSLYVAKCARCHRFYNPAEYSESEWRGWMTRMSRKARLKPEQQEILSRYLEAFRTKEKTSGF
jgi:cytochrome c5